MADIVLMSAMIAQSKSSTEVIKRCKEKGKIMWPAAHYSPASMKSSQWLTIFLLRAEIRCRHSSKIWQKKYKHLYKMNPKYGRFGKNSSDTRLEIDKFR